MGVEVRNSPDAVAAQINFYTSRPEVHDLVKIVGNRFRENYQERQLRSVIITPESGQDRYEIEPFDIDEARVTISGVYDALERKMTFRAVNSDGQRFDSKVRPVNATDIHFANIRRYVEVPYNVNPPYHSQSGWYGDMHTKRVTIPGMPTRSMLSKTPYRHPDKRETFEGYLPKEVRVAGGLVLRSRTH